MAGRGKKTLRLTEGIISESRQQQVMSTIQDFEKLDDSELMDIIRKVEISEQVAY